MEGFPCDGYLLPIALVDKAKILEVVEVSDHNLGDNDDDCNDDDDDDYDDDEDDG